ncbi:MAG: IS256 family transposase [Bacteroidota bacterium]
MSIKDFSKSEQEREAPFDWEAFKSQAIERLSQGEELTGKDGVLTPLIKQILEASLEGELEHHVRQERNYGKKNRKNGKGKKRVKTDHGTIEVNTVRDRAGSFEPKILPKRQTTLGSGLDKKIISMYGRGMSYEDIRAHFEDLYGVEVSKGQISHITDKVLPLLDAWRTRPLDRVYAITWMDALHFKVRKDGRIENRALYCVLGINLEGKKDLLGLYLSENEGAKFWLSVLTDLQNRGVEDILISCIDNLKGFSQAIESIFPQTEVQLCIVHQIRNSLRYITSDDSKPFLKDLKKVYQAKSKESAELHLDELEKKWGEKYPVVILSWRNNWDRLSQYFKYPYQIRRIIYTTNTVEGFNRQIRKITKSKGVMPNDTALLKLVYLVTQNIMVKWTAPIQKWALVIQQLAIHFEGRIDIQLNLGNEE